MLEAQHLLRLVADAGGSLMIGVDATFDAARLAEAGLVKIEVMPHRLRLTITETGVETMAGRPKRHEPKWDRPVAVAGYQRRSARREL